MPFLMILGCEYEVLDLERLVQIFEGSPNWENIQNGTGIHVIECTYRLPKDFTTFRVHNDLKAIAVDGMSLSSFLGIWDIQKGYGKSLRLIDEGYTYDLVISDYKSCEELMRAIEDAENRFPRS
ncbi:hypothetical protein SH661x_001715 [Planctomicrobium sp. SH661]|uniref:hypothetical protein n=1 Tax=Planctomicrobium sp. SH661 TaxID=3448124 RepID=UPI003F5C098D